MLIFQNHHHLVVLVYILLLCLFQSLYNFLSFFPVGKFTLFSCESLSVTVFPSPSVNLVISAMFVILSAIGSVATTLHFIFTSLYASVVPLNADILFAPSVVSFAFDKYSVLIVFKSVLLAIFQPYSILTWSSTIIQVGLVNGLLFLQHIHLYHLRCILLLYM